MRKQLMQEARAARRAFLLSVTLNLITGVIVIGQAWLLSHVIRRTFLEGAPLDAVSAVLWALVGVVLMRALVTAAASDAAARVAIHVKDSLRRRFMAHVLALGPAYTQGERSGELVTAAGEGIEALDAYFRDYLPGLFSALLIPLLILFVVFPLDLLTFAVLLITAPLIPLMMALIGMGTRAVAQRQYASMSLLGAHFLDVMQGLTTLKLFNRSRYQIETIRRITHQFKDATMDVLRVAFLSAFMLEMLATLSVAIVAVEVGLRLIYGGIGNEWESALAASGSLAAFTEIYGEEATADAAIDFLAFSPANPSSIKACLETARFNARAVRTALTAEMWETINSAWLELKEYGNGELDLQRLSDFLRFVKRTSLAYDGSAYRTMIYVSRSHTHSFSRRSG